MVVRTGVGITRFIRPWILRTWLTRVGLLIVRLNWQLVTPDCPDSERRVTTFDDDLLDIAGRRVSIGLVD